jgi:hypothetical protein
VVGQQKVYWGQGAVKVGSKWGQSGVRGLFSKCVKKMWYHMDIKTVILSYQNDQNRKDSEKA